MQSGQKRATMLLLANEGKTLTEIGEKLDFHFSAVKLCLTKYRKGGIEAALNEASLKPHRIRYYLEKRDENF